MESFGPVRVPPLSSTRPGPYSGDNSGFSEEITTLWVGNVPPGTTDDALAAAFGPFGSMLCCFLLKKLSPQGQMSGFVRYEQRAEAALALDAVMANAVAVNGAAVTAKWASQNSTPLGQKPLSQRDSPSSAPQGSAVQQKVADLLMQVMSATQSGPAAGPMDSNGEEITTLWVGNVVPGTKDEDMAAAFRVYGTLLACFLFQKLSPQGQMSGFVRFATREDAGTALQAAEAELIAINGASVRCRWASENSKVTRNLEALNDGGGGGVPGAGAWDAPQQDSSLVQPLQALQQAINQSSPPPGTSGGVDTSQVLQAIQQVIQVASSSGAGGPSLDFTSSGAAAAAMQSQSYHRQAAGYTTSYGEEITTLWVGNVMPGTSDEELAGAFYPYGHLLCCFLLRKLSPQGQLSGFVRYQTKEEATSALDAATRGDIEVNGVPVKVKWASHNSSPLQSLSSNTLATRQPVASSQMALSPSWQDWPPQEEEITTLWVGNALPGTSDADLAYALSGYGQLVCCFLLKKLSPKGQLSGFVRYSTKAEAQVALEAMTSGKVIVNNSIISAKWAAQNSRPLGEKQAQTDILQFQQDAQQLSADPNAVQYSASGEEITTLWVGNINMGTPETDFLTTMVAFGQLICCFILKSVSPQGQLSGFARYQTRQEAALALQAIESGGVALNGTILRARWARENSKPLAQTTAAGASAMPCPN